jgi:bifunctional DNase/RNase
MIEMKISGVGFDFNAKNPYIILRDANNLRGLSIAVGGYEANAIVTYLENQQPPRPLTLDLFATTLKEANLAVTRMEIIEYKGGIFYGRLHLKAEGSDEDKLIDCRPSDGIGLAIRMKTPIFVSEEVMASESFAVDPTKEEQDRQAFHDFMENISPKDFEQYGKNQK